MRLRYTGAAPTVFQTGGVGPLEPGEEFSIPDDLAPAFLNRPDIEPVRPARPAKAAKPSEKPTSSAASAQ